MNTAALLGTPSDSAVDENAGKIVHWMASESAMKTVETMKPFCDRIDVAGSIRRNKKFVKDVEIVCIPTFVEEADPFDLLGERTVSINLLYKNWACKEGSGVLWIKPGTAGIARWHVNPDGKYWRGIITSGDGPLTDGVKLDLFLAKADNYGAILLIRTGSAEFSHAVATHALRAGYKFEGGYLWRMPRPGMGNLPPFGSDAPTRIDTPTEESVFQELNLAWVQPCDRHSADDVRAGWKGNQTR